VTTTTPPWSTTKEPCEAGPGPTTTPRTRNSSPDLLTAHGDTANTPIPVAIETSRGLPAACLRATGRPAYAINPTAAPRHRERHAVARKKSDHPDAMVLANILRTDTAVHRQLPADSEPVHAIAVPAPARQDPAWNHVQTANKHRPHPREDLPGLLAAFARTREEPYSPPARTPAQAAGPTRTQPRSPVKKASRKHSTDAEADHLREALQDAHDEALAGPARHPNAEQPMTPAAAANLGSIGRRNTPIMEVSDGTTGRVDDDGDGTSGASFREREEIALLTAQDTGGAGDRPQAGQASFDDLAGAAAQRRHTRRTTRLSCLDRAVEGRTGRATAEAVQLAGNGRLRGYVQERLAPLLHAHRPDEHFRTTPHDHLQDHIMETAWSRSTRHQLPAGRVMLSDGPAQGRSPASQW
jgi:hypothetical protein